MTQLLTPALREQALQRLLSKTPEEAAAEIRALLGRHVAHGAPKRAPAKGKGNNAGARPDAKDTNAAQKAAASKKEVAA